MKNGPDPNPIRQPRGRDKSPIEIANALCYIKIKNFIINLLHYLQTILKPFCYFHSLKMVRLEHKEPRVS